MLLCQALTMMMGGADKFAIRPSGEILILTPRMGLRSLRSGEARHYVAKYSDLVADDWQVVNSEKLRQLGDAMREAG